MNGDFFTQLNKEVEEFKTQSVRVADGYEFKQRDIIHNDIRTYNSKFRDGEFDDEGFRKFFYNIVRNPCNASAKAIKFKTKDIVLTPAPGQSSRLVWLMNLDLKHYFKTTRFGKLLNSIFRDLPVMGSVVLKKVNNTFHKVDLRNLINEQSADTLKQSSYVIEQHYYSITEIKKMSGLWDNIDEVLEKHRATDDKYIRVIERWGEVREDTIKENGDPTKYVYAQVIAYSPEQKFYYGKTPIASDISNARGDILFAKEKEEEEFPYREFHWEKIPGRWLGVSRIEILTDPQVRTNEIINLRVKSSYFSALNVFQSRDDNFKKNLLKEVANGDVISVMDQITRIPTEERNLAAFDNEVRSWMGSRDENTFTYDVVRGERLPAGTPLGAAQMAAAMVTSYFEQIQEEVASEIKEMIYNDILPAFKNQPEHYVKLVGEDLESYQSYLLEWKLFEERMNFMTKNSGRLPSYVQDQALKQILKEKIKDEDIKIGKNMYKDVKYILDIVITGEEKDLRVQSANMAMVLQTMQQDPEVLTDPGKRKIFGKILETIGMSIDDIVQSNEEPVSQVVQEQKGGGISRPSMPQTMMTGGSQGMEI